MLAYWSKQIALGLLWAASCAGALALLNRLLVEEWALPPFGVLILAGLLLLGAMKGNSGYAPIGPETPNLPGGAPTCCWATSS